MSMLQIAPLVQAFQELWNQWFASVGKTAETLDEAVNLNLESDFQPHASQPYKFAMKSTSTTSPS